MAPETIVELDAPLEDVPIEQVAPDVGFSDACSPVVAGHALSFDPSTQAQYVAIPDAQLLQPTAAFTVEAWLAEQDTSATCILCKPSGPGTDDSFAI